MSGVTLSSKTQALWGGLGVGGTLPGPTTLFASMARCCAITSLEDFGDSHAVGGSVGLR